MTSRVMIATPHYLATVAGAEMLNRGGNAFDAAVAISAALAVVYPQMTGIGGDSLWLLYDAAEGRLHGFNGCGRAGGEARIETFLSRGLSAIPDRGPLSCVTVPGMVDAWEQVSRRGGRLPFGDLLAPAIRWAADGFPVSVGQHNWTRHNQTVLSEYADSRRVFLPGNAVPEVGQLFYQADLARTLQRVADLGRDGFYGPEAAARLAGALGDMGGILQAEDFARHHGDWVRPLWGSYRGVELAQMPPTSQGFSALMILNILEAFPLGSIDRQSAEYYRLVVEATKAAFIDRDRYLGDPEFVKIPLDRLLSKGYARQLAAAIVDQPLSYQPQPMGQDTAYAAVVDEQGNAVSFIQSLYYDFGSAVVAGDTGVLLQNRGSYFSLDADHPNALAPGKRPFHTLAPAMALKQGRPFLLYGTQGGEGQPQTQTAIATGVIDYHLSVREALDEPRWVFGRTWGSPSADLQLESRVPADIRERLQAQGYPVKVVGPWDPLMGQAQAILIDERGVRQGASDPRGDGLALGW